ncbi:MAG TPA: YhjD/YihY/BrkB family envelope integrity protein [Ilumatobacteraceae bacterium]
MADSRPRHHQAEALHRHADSAKARTQRILDSRQLSFPRAVVSRFFKIGGTRQAMLVAFNMFIGFFPLVIIGLAVASKRHPSLSIGDRLVRLIGLSGQTADIIRGAFPSTDRVLLSASVITILSLLLTGLDVAGGVSEAFCRAWDVPPRKGWTSPMRGLAWFGLVMVQFFVIVVLTRSHGRTFLVQHLVGLPLLLIVVYRFWLLTPRLLLNKPLPRRDLRASALVGVAGTAFLAVITQFVLPGWFNSYTRGFGSVGVAFAVSSFLYVVGIVWILIVVIGAVVWERRAPIADVIAFNDAVEDAASRP